jgi:flagellar biosynthesis protein FlhA
MKFADVFVVVAVVATVVMMIIPLPDFILSILLTFNITLSMVILMVAMYINNPLQFSILPSLLLIATLFRLALNISSTRLILLNGYAGEVIQSFGEFVVGKNALVGFIIFLILVIVQFIVITRGSERVAEVAARFTLDAMPGKQMSIDADLNAGVITESEARQRRIDIQKEADFYGAMDGASKFVKGDAIAGIIITIINIVGGLVSGMLLRGLDFSSAVSQYTLLTVGDGLVSHSLYGKNLVLV